MFAIMMFGMFVFGFVFCFLLLLLMSEVYKLGKGENADYNFLYEKIKDLEQSRDEITDYLFDEKK